MTPEPFQVDVPDGVLADLRDRLTRTRWAADYGNDSWRYGVNGDWLRSVVGLLARPVRLAGPGSGHQRLPAVPGAARRHPDPLHPREGQRAGAAAAHPHPRVAVDLLGLPRRHRPAERPRGLRRRPGRRLRRRGAVAPRLRLLDAPRRAGRERLAHRRPVGAADDRRPRLRPLRGPGRRLGRHRHGPHGPPPRQAPDRHPPQLPGPARQRQPHGEGRRLRPRRGGLVRPHAAAHEVGRQPPRGPHQRPADPGLRPQRLPRRPGRLVAGAAPGLERQRRRPGQALRPGLPADDGDDLLGHPEHRHVDALLPRALLAALAARPRPPARHRGAHGHRGVPPGAGAAAEGRGRAQRQPGALDGHGRRRPLRPERAAPGPRRRRAGDVPRTSGRPP